MEGPEITFAEAVLDNGRFGTRTVRFETGRLAQQAQGAVAAYLDEETMLLSATSAGKHPREGFDFFPLTVDVEERSYAAGKIPGSFFRREGRPSTEAILVCRLIDRPLRPSFVEGLRNEVQIVITVLSIAPGEFYDALAINAASLSTQISGLPFYGPIAGVRLALIPGPASPTSGSRSRPSRQLEEAVFDLIVAGRVVTDAEGNEDVAIMMVEAEATEGRWNLIKGGATKPDEAGRRRGPRGVEAVPQAARQAAQNVVANRRRSRSRTSRSSRRTARRPTTSSPARAYDELEGDLPDRRQESSVRTPTTRSRTRVKAELSPPVEAGELPGRRHARVLGARTSRSPRRSCAAASSPRASASTAVAWPTSVRSTPRCRSSRACTARRSSSAARPRSWVSPR